MKLYLVRHTTPLIDTGICYGQSDIDVASSFADESAALGLHFKMPFNAVYSSPLQRCAKLAEALNRGAVRFDTRLKELHFGDWELQAWETIPRDIFDVWAHNYAHIAPPAGETFSQLHNRAKQFMDEMRVQHANENVLVVTHGGVIRAMLAEVLNMPLKGLFRFQIDCASVTMLDLSHEVPKIGFVNQTA